MSSILMGVYTIKDEKALTFLFPFYCQNTTEAVRSFQMSAENPKTSINRWPQEFSLYYLGQFDQTNAKFTMLETPEHVCSAVSVLSQTLQQPSTNTDKK